MINALLIILGTFAFVALLVFSGVIIFAELVSQRRHVTRGLDMALFRVALPTQQNNEEYLRNLEMLLAVLSGLKERARFWRLLLFDRPHIAIELIVRKRGISLYLAFPREFEEQMRKYLYGIFPQILLEESGEYELFPKSRHTTAGNSFRLKDSFMYPVSAHRAEPDIAPLIHQLHAHSQKLAADEAVAIQYLIRPEDHSKNRSALKRIRAIHAGLKFTDAIRFKASKILYQTNMRVLAVTPREKRSYALANEFSGALIDATSSSFNQLLSTNQCIDDLIYQFSIRAFIEADSMTLSTAELAPLIALPSGTHAKGMRPATPRTDWIASKFGHAKIRLALGHHMHKGKETLVGLKHTKDRRSHFYTIGQSGAGKSTLLANMIIQDMRAGRGVGVIDPHGDLIEQLLGAVPENRIDDVILFDPSDTERPLGLNMLEWHSEGEKDLIVQDMLGIFQKLFPPEQIGPIFEHNLRNIMLTLMNRSPDEPEKGATLLDIPRILLNREFRDRIVSTLPKSEQSLRDYWIEEQSKPRMNEGEILQYLISKLGRFTQNGTLRNILGQPVSSFDASDVINGRKILLVNLSKGKIGDLSSALLGLIVVSKLQMALQRQAKLTESRRPDFYLYIDEFQNFTTENIDTLLSEARKYHLNLHLAHQFIAQLPERTRGAIFGNVGTMAAFRIGLADAKVLEQEYAPLVSAYDFVNANNYEAYMRILLGGRKSKPIKVQTLEPPSVDRHLADSVRQRARLRHGRIRADVETAIARRAKLE